MKSTKKSLIGSGIALLACCAMLIGSTFAWFTDSVSNSGNTITAGTLDIELNDGTNTPLFSSDNDFWWEPGRSQKAAATVTNAGNLWLKYTMGFSNVQIKNAEGVTADITKVLDVYTVDENAADLTGASYLGTMSELMTAGSFAANNNILAPNGEKGVVDGVEYDSSDSFTLVIKMKEEAGNEYQGAGVSFDINILAAQYTYEKDGFGNPNYDKDAAYPVSLNVSDSDLLQEALNKVGVPADVTLTETIPNSKDLNVTGNVTLNLGENRLNQSGLDIVGADITVKDGGSLTINAVGPSGWAYNAGKLKTDGEGSALTVNGGKYGDSGAGNANVTAQNGSVITLNSGSFSTSGYQGHAVTAESGSKIYINGGSFSTSGAQSSTIYANGGTIIINGLDLISANGNNYSAANGGVIIISASVSSNTPSKVDNSCTVTQEDGNWVITAN